MFRDDFLNRICADYYSFSRNTKEYSRQEGRGCWSQEEAQVEVRYTISQAVLFRLRLELFCKLNYLVVLPNINLPTPPGPVPSLSERSADTRSLLRCSSLVHPSSDSSSPPWTSVGKDPANSDSKSAPSVPSRLVLRSVVVTWFWFRVLCCKVGFLNVESSCRVSLCDVT